MKKNAFRLMIITLISKLLGFGRDIVLSYFYGASQVSDAYLIALTIPETIFGFVAMGISTGYIPIYSKIEKEEGEESGQYFTNNLINSVLLLSLVFLALAFIFAPFLVRLFASGFNESTVKLAVQLTRVALFSIFFTAMINLFSGYLQIKGNFVIPALIGFPLNIVTIASIIISFYTNEIVLGFGILVAIIAQFLLLVPSVRKQGFKYRFVLDLKDKNLIKIITISIPIIIGVSVNQINVLVDRTLASTIAVGGISAMNYAYMLIFFIQSLFVLPITQILYPTISRMFVANNLDGMKEAIGEAINNISYLVIPTTFGTILFAQPVVELLYGRGQFGDSATYLTTQSLIFYAVGLIGFALREVLSRSFYAMQDTKTPMINASIGVALNVVLNYLLSYYMGIGGLALATSISAIVTSFLLIQQLRKKIGRLGLRKITITIIKITIVSSIMALVAWRLYTTLILLMPSMLALILSVVYAFIVYILILLALVLSAKDQEKLKDLVLNFLKTRKND